MKTTKMSTQGSAQSMPKTKTWQDEMAIAVSAVTKEGVHSWANLIDSLGVPEVIRIEWCTTFMKEVKNLMQDMQKDLEEREKNLQKVIMELKNKITEAAYALGIQATLPVVANMYQEELKLTTYYNSLQEQVKQRHDEVQLLIDRQDKICTTLGKPPKILSVKPLPSATEIEEFLLYVELLEDECFIREEKYSTVQCEVKRLADEIDYEPVGEFEEQILQHSDCPFEVNDKNMFLLDTFHFSLKQHTSNIQTEVAMMIERIKQLWMILETDEQFCNAFIARHTGYTLATINSLNAEIKRLNDLKKANVGMLIKRSQEHLVALWDKCHYSDGQRRIFEDVESNMFTENMLTSLQNEVRRLTKHYDENRNLYESLEKFAETWRRVKELETPEEGQDRYRNRGGKLLIEEKERKVAKKRLDKLEQAIVQMTDDYHNLNHEQFTFEGIPVDEYMKNYNDLKEEKSKLSSKTTLNSARSSNIVESATKILKPVRSANHQSPARRRQPFGVRNEDASRKYSKSSFSGLSRSAPSIHHNPIRSRKRTRKSRPLATFKERSKLIRQCMEQDNCFQNIIDTSMPTLLCNSTAMNATIEQSRLFTLTETPHSSFDDNHDANTSKEPTTPKSNFKNITIRRIERGTKD